MTAYSKDTILASLDHYLPLAERERMLKYHKDYDDGSHQRTVRRLRIYLRLLDAGANIVDTSSGVVYIREGDSLFAYSLLSGRWGSTKEMNHGRTKFYPKKWYKSKSPEDFVSTYVREDK